MSAAASSHASSTASSASAELAGLRAALQDLRAGNLRVPAFCDRARAVPALLAALPPRFGEVLQTLLDSLESAALFSEESCSFSQKDLLDSLDTWAAKAGERLG